MINKTRCEEWDNRSIYEWSGWKTFSLNLHFLSNIQSSNKNPLTNLFRISRFTLTIIYVLYTFVIHRYKNKVHPLFDPFSPPVAQYLSCAIGSCDQQVKILLLNILDNPYEIFYRAHVHFNANLNAQCRIGMDEIGSVKRLNSNHCAHSYMVR